MSWKDIANRKIKERQDRLEGWIKGDSLSARELEITEQDATSLLQAVLSRRYTSEEVTRAYCKRAAIAQASTNCLTEIFFDDGIARAKQLDDHMTRKGPVGPLHGLPISLKDSFKVKGYDTSLGVASLCFKPAGINSALVDQLLSLGAVLYCKTNIPQTLSSLDSHNNIFGRTLNPFNKGLTAGGSSGGEGALVAMKGSPLGIGTDVGGSIRIPSMCNGLVGFKPSHGRIPYAGQQAGGQEGSSKISMEATAGPIARNTRDCELLMRVISNNAHHFDPDVFAQTWQQQTSLTGPLRIGVIRFDGHVQPLPPIQKLMDELVAKLGSTFEVVEVDATSILSQCVKTFNGIMSIDGANAWFDHLEATGEPLSPWLQGRLKRRPAKSVAEVVDLQGQRTALQARFLKIWHTNRLDVIICPAAPHPVAPIDGWNTVNYTAAFNLLDLPAGILPVRKFTEQDVHGEIASKPLNGWDKVNQELWTKVDRKVYIGSSLSVQVVAPRLEERKLVESMSLIADVLQHTPSKL